MINVTEREQKKSKGLSESCKAVAQKTMGDQQVSHYFVVETSKTKVFSSEKKTGDFRRFRCYNNGRRYSLILCESTSCLSMAKSVYTLYELSFPDGKKYIGVTTNVQQRFAAHCCPSSKYKSAVGSAINQWGKENVTLTILKTFPSRNEALQAEKDLVSTDDSFLNVVEGGGKPPVNVSGKPIKIEGVTYPSVTAAAKVLELTRSQLETRIKKREIQFELVSKESLAIKKGRETNYSSCRVVFFNNQCFRSYLQVCKVFGLTKNELLNARKKFGRDHVTLDEVESLRIGSKPITVNGVTYKSRREAMDSGITCYQLYKIINNESRMPSKVAVAMIDVKSGKYLKTFNSLSEATKYVGGKTTSAICMCCQRKKETAYGYKWVYLSEPRITN